MIDLGTTMPALRAARSPWSWVIVTEPSSKPPPSADGGGFDEGSVTITQLQGLRAARNAGIVVPKSIIDKATKDLKDCTTPRGGVSYSLAHGAAAAGGERPPLTAAA